MERNLDYFSQWVETGPGLKPYEIDLFYDPQTSGGLLMSVATAQADALLADLLAAGEQAFELGQVSEGSGRINLI